MTDAGADDDRITRLAHDLRTPLTIVSGFAEMLVRRGEELDAEQRADYAARIDAAAREMRAILDRTQRA